MISYAGTGYCQIVFLNPSYDWNRDITQSKKKDALKIKEKDYVNWEEEGGKVPHPPAIIIFKTP